MAIFDRKAWAKALRIVSALTVHRKSADPIEALVRVEASPEGEGILSAVGLESTHGASLYIEARLPTRGEPLDAQALAVNSRDLKGATIHPAKCKGATVEISLDGPAYLTANVAGQAFELARQSWHADKRLAIGMTMGRVSYDSDQLARALKFVAPAISEDITRAHLCRALFQGQRIIATDGHRLHGADLSEKIDHDLKVSKKCLALVANAITATRAKRVTLSYSAKTLQWAIGGELLEFVIRETRGDSQFPPWEQVVPQQWSDFVSVDSALVADCLATMKRSRVIDPDRGVSVTLNGAMVLAANGHTVFSRRIYLDSAARNETTLGLNPRYLAESLPGQGPVSIRFSGELDPVGVYSEGSDHFAVIMPMRI